jgi:hypothetical protein
MLSTIIVATLFLGLIVASLVLWALLLRFGLRWAKVPDVTTRRVVFTTVAVAVLYIAANVLLSFVSPATIAQVVFFCFAGIAVTIIIPYVVIVRVFNTRSLQALQAWLPTLLAPIIQIALAFLVLRPFVFEGFISSTNGMAPKLLGEHWQGVCPQCGLASYCSPRNERFGRSHPARMICENFHVVDTAQLDKIKHSEDRCLVAKFLKPQRWDIVVFQFPEDPTQVYVKRLVGLLGEKFTLKMALFV